MRHLFRLRVFMMMIRKIFKDKTTYETAYPYHILIPDHRKIFMLYFCKICHYIHSFLRYFDCFEMNVNDSNSGKNHSFHLYFWVTKVRLFIPFLRNATYRVLKKPPFEAVLNNRINGLPIAVSL
jgi:hypothetical protein